MEEYLGIKKIREETPSKKKGEKKKQEKDNEKKRKKSSPLEEAKTKRRASGERKEEEKEEEIFDSANEKEMTGSLKEVMDKLNKLLEDAVERKKYRKETREKLATIENKLLEEKRERLESVELLNKRIDNLENKMKEENEAREKREAEERVRKVIPGDEEGIGQKIEKLENKLECLEEGAINNNDNLGKGEGKGKEENKINEKIKWIVEMNERENRKRNIIIKGLKPGVSGDTKIVENGVR